eukprot:CAMPEP_0184316898 /NCGR_PEP_ID=MMETSP1049-20130417/93170_1 /TAXON_ID=77928 /ORGANISM="Proteomonas sulcata, Strain CCMP704" /LENGTH=50 /DNA_ID=CAMNT_0026636055 /DNA_START=75 /DNA_END=224 /DNA_ORIENTATION=+
MASPVGQALGHLRHKSVVFATMVVLAYLTVAASEESSGECKGGSCRKAHR